MGESRKTITHSVTVNLYGAVTLNDLKEFVDEVEDSMPSRVVNITIKKVDGDQRDPGYVTLTATEVR